MWAKLLLLEALWGNFFPCLSSIQRLTYFIGYWLPSIFKAGNSPLSLSLSAFSLVLILLPPPCPFRDSCVYTQPTWIISLFQGHLISNLNSSCHITNTMHRIQGIECELLWETITMPTVHLIIHIDWLFIFVCIYIYIHIYKSSFSKKKSNSEKQ